MAMAMGWVENIDTHHGKLWFYPQMKMGVERATK